MELSHILFFIFLSLLTMWSYSGYAEQRGWSVGTLFKNKLLENLIFLLLIILIIAGFFLVQWYKVLLSVIVAWLISGAITAAFKANTQLISIISLVIFLVWLLAYLVNPI